MSQNTSSAVMAQRHEPHDSLDFFPTPPWATRALLTHVLPAAGISIGELKALTAHDPCCGRGHMVRPLREYFGQVWASDVHDYGIEQQLHDFLMMGAPLCQPDMPIFNPPFKLALEFVLRALEIMKVGVAMLVRASFLESEERFQDLFRVHPPAIYAPFVERVIIFKGICRDPAQKYWDAKKKEWKLPSSATAYCWIVWLKEPPLPGVTRVQWIPPCRRQLERAGDYDVVPQ